MVINPLSFSRRVTRRCRRIGRVAGCLRRCAHAGEQRAVNRLIVEVPPLGFAVVTGRARTKGTLRRRGADSASSGNRGGHRRRWPSETQTGRSGAPQRVLRGGHRSSLGAVRAIYDSAPAARDCAAGCHAATEDREEEDAYSIMAADDIRIVEAGPVVGEVAVRGRLMDRGGQLLADFRQTTASPGAAA